ncbi:hypothetical protein HID58_025797 [Brassica napus]|uniref:Uncharacterized protein n=1 Tax=Brassica napus TaxID=3708 RepID=A0ABQ8CM52_BRANA|nr:hypothetical protein HID58_025797 [Brassica napus]
MGINERYGSSGYQPIILIDRYEKTAYYAIADCCLLNYVRDIMNMSHHAQAYFFEWCDQEAVNLALKMSEAEKRFRHEKHYHYVSTHDVGHCLIGQRASCMILRGCAMIIIINIPLSRRTEIRREGKYFWPMMALSFLRALLSKFKTPTAEVLSVLKSLCEDPENTVFIVSGGG